jgi:hypothetical protein
VDPDYQVSVHSWPNRSDFHQHQLVAMVSTAHPITKGGAGFRPSQPQPQRAWPTCLRDVMAPCWADPLLLIWWLCHHNPNRDSGILKPMPEKCLDASELTIQMAHSLIQRRGTFSVAQRSTVTASSLGCDTCANLILEWFIPDPSMRRKQDVGFCCCL